MIFCVAEDALAQGHDARYTAQQFDMSEVNE
jgi:hypothetical protein